MILKGWFEVAEISALGDGVVLLHFGIAFICNMPPTALSAKLDDYYSWYLKGTGQWQDGWRMFERPSALNDYYELTVRDVRGARLECVGCGS